MPDPETTFRDIAGRARALGDGWPSDQLARIQGIGLKLFRVDPKGLPPESHPAYAEGLLMLDGEIMLVLGDVSIRLLGGDFQVIPAGVPHEILPGGRGAFLLVDPEPPKETEGSP
ncbi:MAG TPA: cupin domain-containing protein [Aliidongia sp.]|uniref:cupin domain-containing protein n=1 Tax=Aliidongia sp. TaxID=1914230 RepID=UPI002DDCD3D1|nr:cupin domain-containing protein [Aliidongia sp.]HEV2675412.1 cupin domain-containing protein [Aliidongia sp.]